MNNKLRAILNKTKGKKIGLFVDNANWFYPQRELEWKISFKRLVEFLTHFYKIEVLKIYAGTPLDLLQKKQFDKFCDAVKKSGFEIKAKPLKKIWVDRKKEEFIFKCNFDVEIALDVARNIKELDLVVIGSGDSDFAAIRDFASEKNKGFIALCFERGVAWEIRRGYHIFLENIKSKIMEK